MSDCRLCEARAETSAFFAAAGPRPGPAGAPDAVETVRLGELPPLLVCAACADELARQGRAPLGPFEPELGPAPAARWRLPLEAEALRLLALAAPGAGPLGDPAAWAPAALRAGPLDALRARLGLEGEARPAGAVDAPALLHGLAAAVVAGEELGPWDRLSRLVSRLEGPAQLLAGVHAHHAARVRLDRLAEGGELLAAGWPAAAEERQLVGDLLLRGVGPEAVRLDPALGRLLDAARTTYQFADCYLFPDQRAADGGLGHRIALLLAALFVERGDRLQPPATREERSLERAEQALRDHEAAAARGAVAADPRASLLQACIQALKGYKDGCDKALAAGLARAAGEPLVRAQLEHDRWVRAVESRAWDRATDALRSYRAAHPDDLRSRFELAWLYYRRSLPSVAREVLEARSRAAPGPADLSREMGEWLAAARAEVAGDARPHERVEAWRLLHAACLVRLDAPRDALAVLEPLLEEEACGAQVWYVAGLARRALGQVEQALDCFGRAARGSPQGSLRRRARGDLVRAVHAELRAHLDELEASPPVEAPGLEAPGLEALQAPLRLLEAHAEPLLEDLAQVGQTFGTGADTVTLTHADLLGMFLLWELADPEGQARLAGLPLFAELDAKRGPSSLDHRSGADAFANLFLVYRNLVARRLPEAVRCNRCVAESPAPIELVMRLLAALKAAPALREATFRHVAGLVFARLERRGVIRFGDGP